MLLVLFCVALPFPKSANASTILERVLLLTHQVAGLFLNTAETSVQPSIRPAIDGSVTLNVSGILIPDIDRSGVTSQEGSSIKLQHIMTTAFAAINAGDVIIGSRSLGASSDPTIPAFKGLDELSGSLVNIGANSTYGSARAADDIGVRDMEILVPGTMKDQTLLIINLAGNTAAVTNQISTKIEGVSARLGNLAVTGGGVINSGAVMAGLHRMDQKLLDIFELGDIGAGTR